MTLRADCHAVELRERFTALARLDRQLDAVRASYVRAQSHGYLTQALTEKLREVEAEHAMAVKLLLCAWADSQEPLPYVAPTPLPPPSPTRVLDTAIEAINRELERKP